MIGYQGDCLAGGRPVDASSAWCLRTGQGGLGGVGLVGVSLLQSGQRPTTGASPGQPTPGWTRYLSRCGTPPRVRHNDGVGPTAPIT